MSQGQQQPRAQESAGGARAWQPYPAPMKVSAKYRFLYQSRNFVSFNYSDELEVTHEQEGWLRGRSLVTRQPGVFPTAYTTRGDAPGATLPLDTLFMNEVNETLHQWGLLLRQFVEQRKLDAFYDLVQRAQRLLEHRALLWPDADSGAAAPGAPPPRQVSADERKLLNAKVVEEIDAAIAAFDLDAQIRCANHEVATLLNTGPYALLTMHMAQAGGAVAMDDNATSADSDATQSSSSSSSQQLQQQQQNQLQNQQQQQAQGNGSRPGSGSWVPSRVHQLASERPGYGSFRIKTGRATPALSLAASKLGAEPSVFAGAGSEEGKGTYYQIWVKVVLLLLETQDDFEICVSLYARANNRLVTEEWVSFFSKEMIQRRDFETVRVLFKDIESTEFRGPDDMYLVVRVVRVLPLQEGSRSARQSPAPDDERAVYRRPYGAGATCLDLAKIAAEEDEVTVVPMCCSEGAFGALPRLLVEGSASPDIKPTTSKKLVFNVRLFQSSYDELATSNPLVRESRTVGTLKVADLVMPGTVRNDTYVTVDEGDVGEKNAEVLCFVRRNNDLRENLPCIYDSESGKHVRCFRAIVLNSSTPRWGETFRLNLDADLFPACHLYFELRHVGSDNKPGKPYAFGFRRLLEKDDPGKKGIPLYKWHQNKGGADISYLDDQGKKELKSAFLSVAVHFSSTVFTQNEDLNRLFNWRAQPSALTDIVHRVTYISSQEIVRYLEHVFLALFDMLEQNESKPTVLKQIYDNIAYILDKLSESHTAWNFRPAIDEFIMHRYKGTGQHTPLLTCLQKALEIQPGSLSDPKAYKSITTTTKVLDYLWMIIVHSRQNYNEQNNIETRADDGFKQSLLGFLATFRSLLKISMVDMPDQIRGYVVNTLVFALKHFPTILRGMGLFFRPEELCQEIVETLDIARNITVPPPKNDPTKKAGTGTGTGGADSAKDIKKSEGKVTAARLTLYSSVVRSEFFQSAETRIQLLPSMANLLWCQLNTSLTDLSAIDTLGASALTTLFASTDAAVADAQTAPIIRRWHECVQCLRIIGACVDILQVDARLDERRVCVPLMLYLLPLVLKFTDYMKSRVVLARRASAAAAQPRRDSLSTACIGGGRASGAFAEGAGEDGGEERGGAVNEREDLLVMTIVLGLLRVMTPEDWEGFLQTAIVDERERVLLLTKLCKYLTQCCGSGAFPKSWGMMVGFQFSTVLKFVRTLEASPYFRAKANAFNAAEQPPPAPNGPDATPEQRAAAELFEAERGMWEAFFAMCVGFQMCRALEQDKLSLLFQERYGDLRDPMSVVTRRTWKFFSRKFQLFPGVLKSFLQLADMPRKMITTNALEGYFSTVLFDYEQNRNLDYVKAVTLDALTALPLSATFCATFFHLLKERFDAVPQLQPLWPQFDEMNVYISLTRRLDAVPDTEAMQDTRVSLIHEILDFLRASGQTALFIEYVNRLCTLFVGAHDFAALGHAMLLHADLYTYDDHTLLPALSSTVTTFKAQEACARREALCVAAAQNLNQGQAFECAYAVLQDARRYNAEQAYDLLEVTNVLRMQALAAKSIAERQPIPPEYYRVGFFGSDVDELIRNKEFVYLAHSLEKLVDFQERLEKQYPGCEFLKKTDYPGPDVTDTPGLKILVTPVKACTPEEVDPEHAPPAPAIDPANPTVLPQGVALPMPATTVFLYSKPFRPVERQKGENEFVGLFLNKLFLHVKDAFPSSRCRSVVTKRVEVIVTPLENAISSVVDKTKELHTLIAKFNKSPEDNPQPFIMLMNGVICAAVNGGTWMYKEAFLGNDYRTAHPDETALCDKLLSSIVDQIHTLESGMDTLDRICHMGQNESMLGLISVMQEQLKETRVKWNVTD